ncbi:hypothetical protein [Polynucleobacter sp. MWH-Adler-W8]|jgi:hypothetical protein|uniref:hypothetical protein n=1 Tax=Polynucleobacter sp. MWH-Adler-W8 TaxID=1819727 RepID=UPI0009263B13|nr:hypothetical protein [Polynucleobacter sp. MWH-Adler-W8]OJI05727.1 hypothetical protein AOC28_02000 [Polynucleobacter sp. MWH-Adler-W8]
MSSIQIPRIDYQDFFDKFGNLTDVVTILLKKRHPTFNVYWRTEFAKSTAHWCYDRLNKKVYGRRYMDGHKQLGIVVSHEIGDKSDRPHLHIAIGRPAHLSEHKFHQLIIDAFMPMEWRYQAIHIENYYNSGFLRYMCKGDFEKIIYFEITKG